MIVWRPGFVSEFSRAGHGAKHPFELAGDDVEALDMTGCGPGGFRQVQRHDDGIFEDRARRGRSHKAVACGAAQPFPEINPSAVAEICDQRSVVGIQGMQETSGGEEDAPVLSVLPVYDPSALVEPLGIARTSETPDLDTRGGLQGEDLLRCRRGVKNAVDDDRIGLHLPGGIACVVFPGLLQLRHVRCIDLVQGHIVVPIRTAVVFAPFDVGRAGSKDKRDEEKQ